MDKNLTYEEKIKRLDEALKKARDERTSALTTKKHLEKELAELRKKAEEMGVDPDKLGEKIQELKEEIEKMLEEAKNLLPPEYREKVGF
ncbi:hypothetical protein SAMN02745221_01444 [Thermosyntropha lipolytica DSM 11003]|uniref:Uncharacterized protein n=1 Tax=Thermosyntropha lipolytica DSM 11003 TaxID=1123382 RepID=A0A1M5PDY7_9FIRM|nr:hypothetical protein [Thermosyntropha lipolytica]SHG99952.1 hypothetical protein SAMN02745221_01444 [Thermosyntropha lipolytica DSM 11003]